MLYKNGSFSFWCGRNKFGVILKNLFSHSWRTGLCKQQRKKVTEDRYRALLKTDLNFQTNLYLSMGGWSLSLRCGFVQGKRRYPSLSNRIAEEECRTGPFEAIITSLPLEGKERRGEAVPNPNLLYGDGSVCATVSDLVEVRTRVRVGTDSANTGTAQRTDPMFPKVRFIQDLPRQPDSCTSGCTCSQQLVQLSLAGLILR
jgi:hypothetical protein